RRRAQARLLDQCCYAAKLDAAVDLLDAAGQAPAPIGVRVGGTRQIRLLDLGEHILELNQHQTSARAAKICEDGGRELGRIDRLAAFGEKFLYLGGCNQLFPDESVEQETAIAVAL